MENPKVIIVDCDHANIDPEHEVLTGAGIPYKRLQCNTQEEAIAQCQGAVVFINQYLKMDENIFKNIPSLKHVVRYGVGVDNVNLADATKYGVQVTNVPDYGINEVADHSLALMLCLTRKVSFLNRRVHEGVWKYSEAMPIMRLVESTVGVIGLGRIGTAFAKRAKALGCRVVGYDKAIGAPGFTVPDFVEAVDSLEQLLAQSDVVSLHSTLDDSNKNMINAQSIAKMKDGAFIVNTSRGGLIDEAALVDAIKSGKLGGAGLDVAVKEPIQTDHPLLAFDNVIITPHVGWHSGEAAKELKRKCAEDAVNFVTGKPVRYPVNKLA